MFFLDLTLPTPQENLALDEALLDSAESGELEGETLRVWESPRPIVVLGRSSRAEDEVRLDRCAALDIPVLRRASGGTSIGAGPGCLMYALVLDYRRRQDLRPVDAAHCFVLSTIAKALKPLIPTIGHRGTSDLAVGELKCSGNSMRCKQDHFLYHGTLLYDFPLSLLAECLSMPPRQPAYRQGRPHAEFVTNLALSAGTLRDVLRASFGAWAPRENWPMRLTRSLADEKYATREWTFRH
jgi:lipoate-protein ligase A